VACVVLHERGFGVLAHKFLCSLLQFYSLELHHLTPSGILHMIAFVTLCEAYMGIEPHFNLWNYFFCTRLHQGSGVEVAALGSVDIFIRFSHGVDCYFHLLMSISLNGWQKVWFFLRNDTNVLLLVFTGSRPIPQPNRGYDMAQRDLHSLEPLCEVVQQLL
jgi:hypothetical protein